jgi:hypothetical protein
MTMVASPLSQRRRILSSRDSRTVIRKRSASSRPGCRSERRDSSSGAFDIAGLTGVARMAVDVISGGCRQPGRLPSVFARRRRHVVFGPADESALIAHQSVRSHVLR